MPRPQYKQRCTRCRKNMVLTTARNPYPVCFPCQENELKGEITDPAMKKFFDIPDPLYKESSFLRSIKINYLKYGKISEKQREYFLKTVDKLSGVKPVKEPKKDKEKDKGI